LCIALQQSALGLFPYTTLFRSSIEIFPTGVQYLYQRGISGNALFNSQIHFVDILLQFSPIVKIPAVVSPGRKAVRITEVMNRGGTSFADAGGTETFATQTGRAVIGNGVFIQLQIPGSLPSRLKFDYLSYRCSLLEISEG